MKKGIAYYFLFLILALVSAFIFEEVPRLIMIALGVGGALHVWEAAGAVFFIFWYGIIFSIAYLIFKNKPIKYSVIYGIVVGLLAETFLFKKMNPVSFFIFIVLYGLMFYLPFKIHGKLVGDD